MRYKTEELKRKTWHWLQRNQHLNGFQTAEEFVDEFQELGEVLGNGQFSFCSRRREDSLFEAGNLCLINIEAESDWERVTFPAVKGGTE